MHNQTWRARVPSPRPVKECSKKGGRSSRQLQGLLANTDRSVELSRQTIAQFEKGNFEAGNKLIDQRNELVDAAIAGWDDVGPRVDNYDLRVDACTT